MNGSNQMVCKHSSLIRRRMKSAQAPRCELISPTGPEHVLKLTCSPRIEPARPTVTVRTDEGKQKTTLKTPTTRSLSALSAERQPIQVTPTQSKMPVQPICRRRWWGSIVKKNKRFRFEVEYGARTMPWVERWRRYPRTTNTTKPTARALAIRTNSTKPPISSQVGHSGRGSACSRHPCKASWVHRRGCQQRHRH